MCISIVRNQESKEEELVHLYLEPIPTNSFTRYKLLKLFTDAGLVDFEAQILLSLILHGGQMKPSTLATDLSVNPTRLEFPDGFPSLIKQGLIATTHNRPKTVILTCSLEEIIERLKTRSFNPKGLLDPKEAYDLMKSLHNYCIKQILHRSTKEFMIKTIENNPLYLSSFFECLEKIKVKMPNLFYIVDFAFSSLRIERNQSIILSLLISNGGKVSKRHFYMESVKTFDPTQMSPDIEVFKENMVLLDYSKSDIDLIKNQFELFHQQDISRLQFSTEQYFNILLNNLSNFCQSTSQGEKSSSRKTVYLVLTRSLLEIADILYQQFKDFEEQYKTEIFNLKMAYTNVRLVDREIFLSTIASSDSTKKRLRRDLKHARKVRISLVYETFIKELFMELFNCTNTNFTLELIVSEELHQLIVDVVNFYIKTMEEQRGIQRSDKVTFISVFDIPADHLENTIIINYENGSSKMTIHEDITVKNPVDITTIRDDIDSSLEKFKEIIEKDDTKSIDLLTLQTKNQMK